MVTTPTQWSDKQLRRNRIVAVLVLLGIAALMTLLMWLAAHNGGAPPQQFDYWPMMP